MGIVKVNRSQASIARSFSLERSEDGADEEDLIDAAVTAACASDPLGDDSPHQQHRQHQQHQLDYLVDEDTKIRLALRTSTATLPGAVPGAYNLREGDGGAKKPSSPDHLENYWNARRILKTRPLVDSDDDLRPWTSPDDERGLDMLQRSMTDHQQEECVSRRDVKDHAVTRKCRNRILFIAAGALILVIGISVGVVVGIRAAQEGVDDDQSRAKKFAECLVYDSYASRRFLEQRQLLLSHSSNTTLDNIDYTGTNQRAALCWLSEVDKNTEGYVAQEGAEMINSEQAIQRFALACFYYHFVPPGASQNEGGLFNSNWLSNAHVCDWEFLVCDGSHVTELSLEAVKLKKTIPNEIALLSSLEVLRMTRTGLIGTIPSDLSSLTRLEVLNLGMNELTGRIPSEMAALGQLREFSLWTNMLVGQLPDWLFEFSHLELLRIGDNSLTGTIPKALSQSTRLTELAMNGNGFTGTIPDISKFSKLETISLESNQLEGSLPDFSLMTNLESVFLYDFDATGTIPSSLLLCPNLKSLRFSETYVSGTIPSWLGLLTNLEMLVLTKSKVRGKIPTEIGNLLRLSTLDLGDLLAITGTVPSELGRLSKLDLLSLPTKSRISGTVPLGICNLINNPLTEGTLVSIKGPCPPQCECCVC